MSDEFYIGWEPKASASVRRTLRVVAVGLLLVAVIASLLLAGPQRLIGLSNFEWGNVKFFSGTLQITPYPHLLVSRPGQTGELPGYSTYQLVSQWKFGLDPAALSSLEGKPVKLKGTLIYRENQTMIETKNDWIQADKKVAVLSSLPPFTALGHQTLKGEIVDSKCFLGVMNPGQSVPHRACAIRCISGGIPPVFLVRQQGGPAICLLLVSLEGKPVNKQVLDLVAEPLEISGEVERQGDLLIFRANLDTYRRL